MTGREQELGAAEVAESRVTPGITPFSSRERLDGPGATPEVITLCGSTRFKDAFLSEMRRLTLTEAAIVIPVGVWGHDEGMDIGTPDNPNALKIALDALHFRKIDISDRIHVIDVGGYIGTSTRNEINYAESLGKPVTYMTAVARAMSLLVSESSVGTQ